MKEYFNNKGGEQTYKRIFHWIRIAFVLLVGSIILGIVPFIVALFQNPTKGFAFIGFMVIFIGTMVVCYEADLKINDSSMGQKEKKIIKLILWIICLIVLYYAIGLAHDAGIISMDSN